MELLPVDVVELQSGSSGPNERAQTVTRGHAGPLGAKLINAFLCQEGSANIHVDWAGVSYPSPPFRARRLGQTSLRALRQGSAPLGVTISRFPAGLSPRVSQALCPASATSIQCPSPSMMERSELHVKTSPCGSRSLAVHRHTWSRHTS
jgi:hypothetical protein